VSVGASPSEDDFEADEPTCVVKMPSLKDLGLAPGTPEKPTKRAIKATLASTPSVLPANARQAPAVDVIDEDDQRPTLEPSATPATVQ
jgi:hypothetical protein